MAVLLATQNAPLSFHDSLSTNIRRVFPDSQIILTYYSAPTNATCMLNGLLDPFLLEELTSAMKHQPFSVCIDRSNDTAVKYMNPLTVQICDFRSGKIVNLFLDMCETTSAKTEVIYTALNEKIYQLLSMSELHNYTSVGVNSLKPRRYDDRSVLLI